MVYQCFTPPHEVPFYTPMEAPFYTPMESFSNPVSPTGGYFPPASVWGAQRASQVDLSTRAMERAMDVIVEVETPAPEPAPSAHFPFGAHLVAETTPAMNGLSPALPESPALVPPTPDPLSSSPLGVTYVGPMGEPWPNTAPLRVNSGRRTLNRKLPPSMTESLEMLVLSHKQQQPEHTDTLGSVPEESSTGGTVRRPPIIKLGTMQKIQQLQQAQVQQDKEHRRTASSSFKNSGSPGARPTALPRSPSMPVVPTSRKLVSRPSLPRLPTAISIFSSSANSPPKIPQRRESNPSKMMPRRESNPTKMMPRRESASSRMVRRDSASSGYASSSHSNEWITTPVSSARGLPSAPMPTPAFERGPLEFNLSNMSSAELKRERAEKEVTQALEFGSTTQPEVAKLLHASELEVIDEEGNRVRFGDIVGGTRRTVVIFIRHWLSSFCSQYVKSIITELPPTVLAGSRARLVIVGNGSEDMIAGFKNHFNCPFPIYTDPTRRLHDTLGLLPHPLGPQPPKGDYVVQNAVMRSIETLQLAARLHGFRRSGDREQLGAEFVFDGSLRVIYAHRMSGVADHAPVSDIREVLSKPSSNPYGSRTPAASRSCLSLPPPPREKKADKDKKPERATIHHSQGGIPTMPNSAPPIPAVPRIMDHHLNSHSQPNLHQDFFQPPPKHTLPRLPRQNTSPALRRPSVDAIQSIPPHSRANPPVLQFPLPPLRVSEEECARWDNQRQGLLATRRKPSSPRRTFSEMNSPTIVNSEDHDLDSVTGEVVRTLYAA